MWPLSKPFWFAPRMVDRRCLIPCMFVLVYVFKRALRQRFCTRMYTLCAHSIINMRD